MDMIKSLNWGFSKDTAKKIKRQVIGEGREYLQNILFDKELHPYNSIK